MSSLNREEIEEIESYSRTPAVKLIKSWTTDDFLKRQFPPKEPLIEGLLHKRDFVAFGARRRHGKTTFVMDMAIAGASGAKEFIGYRIVRPFRTLLFMLEDDAGELQDKLKTMVGNRDLGDRLRIVSRNDFHDADCVINIRESGFCRVVECAIKAHKPDAVVFDNLAQIVSGDYSDAKVIHEVFAKIYPWAKEYGAAFVIPAHPKKLDLKNEIHLEQSPEIFVEQIMGTSHFINSTGSIWALERRDDVGRALFMGGRQRADGHWGHCLLYLDDSRHFQVIADNLEEQLKVVTNTEVRRRAWELLPNHPQLFGYREAEGIVKKVMRSNSTFHAWFEQCRRNKVIEDINGKHRKVQGLPELKNEIYTSPYNPNSDCLPE
jgi:hypothetical protein